MKGQSLEEKMIRSLLERKKEYEDYFKASVQPDDGDSEEEKKKKKEPEIDNQATNAYTGLIKTIVELSRKSPKEAKNPVELKRLAEEILENEYGIKRQ